jgi:hypothetical protein
MTADRTARATGLALGVLLGLAVVIGLAMPGALGQDAVQPSWHDETAEPAERPTWLYDLPAEPAPLTELPETV